MKLHSLKLLVLTAVIGISAVMVSANVTAGAIITKFDVGFDFQIGGKEYSKGTYELKREAQNVFILSNLETGSTKVLLGGPSRGFRLGKDESKLTFHRYGSKYFLRGVISPVADVRLGASKAEKRLRKISDRKLDKLILKSGG